jgi:hypothetical protein
VAGSALNVRQSNMSQSWSFLQDIAATRNSPRLAVSTVVVISTCQGRSVCRGGVVVDASGEAGQRGDAESAHPLFQPIRLG